MKGARELERKLNAIPASVRRALRNALARGAERIVETMRRLAPDFLRGKIAWTFGAAPSGALSIGSFSEAGSDLKVTIFVRDYRARWFEFGTSERYHKKTGRYTGRIQAQPYFWPGFRLNRKHVRAMITREMGKAIREAIR